MLGRLGKAALCGVLLGVLLPVFAAAQIETVNDVYKKALTEGGTLNYYSTIAQINAEKILPIFEKRIP